ncbi:MAG: hypothetical protein EHM91_05940 [Planctomycetota bacterium]|nr:MAG: hypothetical protein EHM91_05940 [Planctomycetota bacterium]
MSNVDDPIRTVKSYLRHSERLQVPGPVARDLREIARRLDRARQIDDRLQISSRLEQLFRAADIRPATQAGP